MPATAKEPITKWFLFDFFLKSGNTYRWMVATAKEPDKINNKRNGSIIMPGHNCAAHTYRGHHYIGHDCIGHGYIYALVHTHKLTPYSDVCSTHYSTVCITLGNLHSNAHVDASINSRQAGVPPPAHVYIHIREQNSCLPVELGHNYLNHNFLNHIHIRE